MAWWLMKSEPAVYPWSRLVAEGRGGWDGVRNHQAANNLRAMRVGDEALFYHSNEGREVVGIMRIIKTAYPDQTDASGKFVMVDVAPVRPLRRPIPLAELKTDPVLKHMTVVRQARLSVSPVAEAEWRRVLQVEQITDSGDAFRQTKA